MTANPLNTAMLCLLCEDFQGILPESRTQLYLDIVQCVLMRYRKKKGLPVENEDLIKIYNDELKLLGLIALNRLYEDNMYFEDKKLAKKDADLPGFGVLSAQPGSSKRRPCMCYGFTHKSFQDFVAGHYLRCQLVSKEISPEILVTDTRYFQELRECIKECKIENSNFHMELARTFLTFGACLKVQHAQSLGGKGINDTAVAVLAAVLEANTTLTNLNLSLNNIGSAGAESLATALKTNTNLTKLNLRSNNIGPAGGESLATGLKTNTTLKNLNLSFNSIGPAGAESLAAALRANTTLTNLNLSDNDIGPAGAESLATVLKTNTTLTNLDLRGNNIGPAGAESLATVLKTN
ncbi:unnamed protein product, partial [Porites lobata]